MQKLLCTIAILFAAMSVPAAYADATYNYVGNSFTSCSGFWYPTSGTTCQGQVQLSFETSLTTPMLDNLVNQDISPTVITGFGWDGNPYTGKIICSGFDVCDNEFNTGFFSIVISTNAIGVITSWSIFATNTNDGAGVTSVIESSNSTGDSGRIDTFNTNCDPALGACNGQGSVSTPGTWSGPVPTAEPATAGLMLVGMALLMLTRQRIGLNLPCH